MEQQFDRNAWEEAVEMAQCHKILRWPLILAAAAHIEALESKVAALTAPIESDDWKALMNVAYQIDSEGALRINRITGDYLKMQAKVAALEAIIARKDEMIENIQDGLAAYESQVQALEADRERLETVNSKRVDALIQIREGLQRSLNIRHKGFDNSDLKLLFGVARAAIDEARANQCQQ